MYIQSAELTASPGKSSDLGPMVTNIRDFLSEETGREWWSWAVLAGRPFGTQLLSTRVDGFAQMVEGQMKLAGSADWAKLSGSASGILAHPAETYLAEVIAVTGEPADPKQFITVTRATMGTGGMADTVAWSTKVMEHATKVTGNGGMVALSAAGRFFEVWWFSGSDTAEEVDSGNEALNGDADYAGMIDEAGAAGMFVDGSVERMMLVKMP